MILKLTISTKLIKVQITGKMNRLIYFFRKYQGRRLKQKKWRPGPPFHSITTITKPL